MKRSPLNRASVMQRPLRDLFGEVPITRADVYAWLLIVVNLDPDSMRALAYVKVYGVLDKIVAAMADGTFDEITARARRSSRYRELVLQSEQGIGGTGFKTAPASEPQTLAIRPTESARQSRRKKTIKPGYSHLGGGSGNCAGTGAKQATLLWSPPLSGLEPPKKPLRAPNRPRAVIEREQARARAERENRKRIDASMLRRLPRAVPPLSVMLEDIGLPSAEHLAAAMRVRPGTARRWMRADEAPRPVMLALFWITKWGMSAADTNAHNDAVMSATLAAARDREVMALQRQVTHVQRLADFGSANDPLPAIEARPGAPGYPVPAALEVPVVFTSLRRAPCAASARKKKRA